MRMFMKKIFSTIIFLICWNLNLSAQYSYDEIKETVYKYIGTSNMGTEFVFAIHPGMNDDKQNSRVKIFITSKVITEVRLIIPGISNSPLKTKQTIPNELIEIVLKPGESQPYIRGEAGLKTKLEPTKVWQGRAIILESDEPIIAYVSVQYENSTDGFLAIPSHLLEKEYVISSFRETSPNENSEFSSYVSIAGVFDKTRVNFAIGGNPSANNNIKTQDNKLWKPYDVIRADLNRGDLWLISSVNPFSDLGGSYVSSTKPISVYSGTFYSHIPNNDQSGDYLIEQEIGMKYWGNKYYVSPIFGRNRSSTIRVFNSNPDFGIYSNYSSDSLKYYETWGLQNKAWMELVANPSGNLPAVYWSKSSINIIQYNRGSDAGTNFADPFQMQVLSDINFQDEIYFFVPGTPAQSFKDNFINLIYRAKNGQIPNDLQIGFSEKGKPFIWKKIEEVSDNNLGLIVPDPEFNDPNNAFYSKTIRITNPGVYKIRNFEPIAAYLYGFGLYQGYGSIASFNYAEPEKTEKPNIIVMIAPDQKIDSILVVFNQNRTGVVQMDNECQSCIRYAYFHKGISYNAEFTLDKVEYPVTKVNYNFKVTNANKNAMAALTAVDVWGNKKTSIIKYLPSSDYTKTITINKPKGGDVFRYGDVINLNWSSNFSENVKIELFKGDKSILTYADNIANSGTYHPFTDKNLMPPGNDYRIKISSLEDPDIFTFSENFELTDQIVKQITLLSPNQPGSYKKGQTISIAYQRNSPFSVDIWIYKNGVKVYQIAKNYEISFKEWIIPNDFPFGDKFVIRVSSVEEPEIYGESPLFSILPNENEITLKVISPYAGDKYNKGDKINIKCETNYKGKYKIELMRNTQRIKIINFSVEGIENYEWVIPSDIPNAKDYSIKVTESVYSNITAESGLFEIAGDVSIFEEMIKDVQIIPNPTNGILNLYNIEDYNVTKVKIMDIYGQERMNFDINHSKQIMLDLNILESGNYLLLFYRDDKILGTKQVLVVK